ncbi:GNAT family N-acetyltransferase [Candidatus Bathyarchaeota archaeon]|nr:GNAT family N-acetyltransferase [Candidatus Bathyarchaeota archaeon]
MKPEPKPSRNGRYLRSYSPEGLKVLRGPGESYGEGSTWVVADGHGHAQVTLMPVSESIHPGTLYIENLEVLERDRGGGYGRVLYLKTERFAENVGAMWIQIDSEEKAVGFWERMGFKETGRRFYAGKRSMVKKIS